MLLQFNYRKQFGLTYQEYLDEPAEIFMVNNEIANAISENERHQLKKMNKR